MFTGIIEATGNVSEIRKEGTNITFRIESHISEEVGIDQSISHDGVCLTVVNTGNNWHEVTAVSETLDKSNLGEWEKGTIVNLERCMISNGRFDGHIVQGHVDQVATVEDIAEMDGSWIFRFGYSNSKHLTVEKGSISVNGISLTCFDTSDNGFAVAIIPYTYENTNFKNLRKGDSVNLEFDIVGKYIEKILSKRST